MEVTNLTHRPHVLLGKDAATTADDNDDDDDVYSHKDISSPSDCLGGRDEAFRPPMMFLVEVLG